MSNPFEYYNKEVVYYERKDNKKIPQIIMKYKLKRSYRNNTFTISDIYNSRFLHIPEDFIDDECNIKDEYKFIINEEITPENLPNWFLTWTNNYNDETNKEAFIQETFIPDSFTLVLYKLN